MFVGGGLIAFTYKPLWKPLIDKKLTKSNLYNKLVFRILHWVKWGRVKNLSLEYKIEYEFV